MLPALCRAAPYTYTRRQAIEVVQQPARQTVDQSAFFTFTFFAPHLASHFATFFFKPHLAPQTAFLASFLAPHFAAQPATATGLTAAAVVTTAAANTECTALGNLRIGVLPLERLLQKQQQVLQRKYCTSKPRIARRVTRCSRPQRSITSLTNMQEIAKSRHRICPNPINRLKTIRYQFSWS